MIFLTRKYVLGNTQQSRDVNEPTLGMHLDNISMINLIVEPKTMNLY